MDEQLEYEINRIASDAIEGNTDAMKAFIRLKALASYVADSIKAVEPSALLKADDYEGQELMGNIIRTQQGARYDYKHYEGWKEINDKRKRLEKIMKDACNSNTEALDPETGEVIPPAEKKLTKVFIKLEKPQ